MDPSSPTDQDSNENDRTSVGLVKDVETGKEFSILEFENEKGVRMTSPIMREGDRRARERWEKSEVISTMGYAYIYMCVCVCVCDIATVNAYASEIISIIILKQLFAYEMTQNRMITIRTMMR